VGRRHQVVRGAACGSTVRGTRAGRRIVCPPGGRDHEYISGIPAGVFLLGAHRRLFPAGIRRLLVTVGCPPPVGCPASPSVARACWPRGVGLSRSLCLPQWRPTSAVTIGKRPLSGRSRMCPTWRDGRLREHGRRSASGPSARGPTPSSRTLTRGPPGTPSSSRCASCQMRWSPRRKIGRQSSRWSVVCPRLATCGPTANVGRRWCARPTRRRLRSLS